MNVVEWVTYDRAERVHERHLDHVARDQAERCCLSPITSASRSSAHRPDVKYYVANWSESPRDEEGAALKESNAKLSGPAAGIRSGHGRRVQLLRAGACRPTTIVRSTPAKLVPADTDISFQVHYTPIGKEVVDRPLVGFTVSDTPPEKRWMSYGIVGGGPDFAIPPNAGNYRARRSMLEFTRTSSSSQMMPHMHLRGKDMTYHLIYPDGRDEIVAERAEVRLQLAARSTSPRRRFECRRAPSSTSTRTTTTRRRTSSIRIRIGRCISAA